MAIMRAACILMIISAAGSACGNKAALNASSGPQIPLAQSSARSELTGWLLTEALKDMRAGRMKEAEDISATVEFFSQDGAGDALKEKIAKSCTHRSRSMQALADDSASAGDLFISRSSGEALLRASRCAEAR